MKCKRIISLIIISVFIFSNVMGVYAKESNVYEQIVEEYNDKYDVSLGFVEVSKDFDVNEFRKIIKEAAKQERETLDFIKSRNDEQNTIFEENLSQSMSYAQSTILTSFVITQTKPGMSASFFTGDQYSITCSYTNYGDRVGNPTYVNATMSDTLIMWRAYVLTGWSYNIIDQGRTLAITVAGDLTCAYKTHPQDFFVISGVTAYTEYYK